MNENILLVIFAVIVLLIAVGIWMTIRKRRTDHLRDRFGEEYDRTLDNAGDRTKAERALEGLGDGFGGEIVPGGTQPPRADDDGGARGGVAEDLHELREVVGDGHHAQHLDAELEELAGDPVAVGVDGLSGGELISLSQEDGGVHGTPDADAVG